MLQNPGFQPSCKVGFRTFKAWRDSSKSCFNCSCEQIHFLADQNRRSRSASQRLAKLSKQPGSKNRICSTMLSPQTNPPGFRCPGLLATQTGRIAQAGGRHTAAAPNMHNDCHWASGQSFFKTLVFCKVPNGCVYV